VPKQDGTCPSCQTSMKQEAHRGAASSEDSEHKECPFCAETIRTKAIKCKHCNEFLEPPTVKNVLSTVRKKVGNMNITQGFKRIILVLAVLAMVPGFLMGWNIYDYVSTQGKKPVAQPTYIIEPYIEEEGLQQNKGDGHSNKPVIEPVIEPAAPQDQGLFHRLLEVEEDGHETTTPPTLNSAVAGVTGAVVSFLIVLLCLRIVLRVVVWVVDGFRGAVDQSQEGTP